ncbi:MAG TPA: hypothetical protein VGP62_30010 [Bryobacteraceae bacterium]|jgi:O-antigen/teichoic acid export membrane protein|nr:hypothetical protein [Bryobacteraceae bacterium]
MPRGFIHFLCVTTPKVLGGIGTLAINLLLIRSLTADDLGMLSLCLAGVLLIDAVAGTALDMGTLKLASASYAQSPAGSFVIQRHSIYLKLILMAGVTVLVPFVGPQLWEAVTHRPGDTRLLYLTCAAALGLLLIRSAQLQLQVEQRFVLYGLLDLVHLVLRFGGIGLLIVLGRAVPANILLCFALAPLTVAFFWATVWGRAMWRRTAVRPAVITEIFHCVKWFLATFSLSAFISRMDLILLARWANLHEAGIFSAGQIFAIIPQMIGLYGSIILGPRIMPLIAAGKFYHFFRLTQAWILALVAAALVAFVPVWKMLATFVLPPRYLASSAVIQVLMPGALAGLATFPLTLTFLMFVKPRFLFLMDCASLPFLVALYAWAIQHYGALGAAWTTTFAAVARATVAQVVAWRLAGTKISGPLTVVHAQMAVSET